MGRELNGDRGLVLVKGYAGLADRLKGRVEAIAFAEVTGRRVAVDWSDEYYSGDGRDVFFRYFQSDTLGPWPAVVPTGDVHPPAWAACLDLTVKAVRESERRRGRQASFVSSYQIDVSRYDDQAPVVVVIKGGANKKAVLARLEDLATRRGIPREALRTGIRKRDYPDLVREIMAEHTRLQPALRAEVERFRERCLGTPVIGLHIRYTDRICDLSRVLTALDDARAQQPDAAIFLATDSDPVAAMITRRYPGVVTREIARSHSADALHYWHRRSQQAFVGGRDALIDMYLLTSCDSLLFCRDHGFASLAATLSPIPEVRKIAYHGPDESILTKYDKLTNKYLATVTVLVPVHGQLPTRCLKQLGAQDYPKGGVKIAVFGDLPGRQLEELAESWPDVQALPGRTCRIEDVVGDLDSKIIAVADPDREHGKAWLRSRVDQLITTPLCALLHDAEAGADHPREIVMLSAVPRDPALADLPLELTPKSPWGRAAVALGYHHVAFAGC